MYDLSWFASNFADQLGMLQIEQCDTDAIPLTFDNEAKPINLAELFQATLDVCSKVRWLEYIILSGNQAWLAGKSSVYRWFSQQPVDVQFPCLNRGGQSYLRPTASKQAPENGLLTTQPWFAQLLTSHWIYPPNVLVNRGSRDPGTPSCVLCLSAWNHEPEDLR